MDTREGTEKKKHMLESYTSMEDTGVTKITPIDQDIK